MRQYAGRARPSGPSVSGRNRHRPYRCLIRGVTQAYDRFDPPEEDLVGEPSRHAVDSAEFDAHSGGVLPTAGLGETGCPIPHRLSQATDNITSRANGVGHANAGQRLRIPHDRGADHQHVGTETQLLGPREAQPDGHLGFAGPVLRQPGAIAGAPLSRS